MIRDSLKDHLDHDPDFVWRGQSVTRIENLSDIVFALSLGMMVSASEPPQTMGDLTRFLISIVPVTAGFAILLGIWNSHFVFFRRYGLADGRVVFINACLLFAVLYLAFPLRFAFDSFFGFVLMTAGDPSWITERDIDFDDSGVIMAYFAGGFAVLQSLMSALFSHAVSKREVLELSKHEISLTRFSRTSALITATVAVGVGVLALVTPLNGFAGVFMFLNWPIIWLASKRHGV
ncbi:MAG: TMEM175 family protein [Pseudomonadota bacterium]